MDQDTESSADGGPLSDVSLRIPENADAGSSLMVSFDLFEVGDSLGPGHRMLEGALLPHAPWRPPTDEELSSLILPPDTLADWNRTVAIASIDPVLLREIHLALGNSDNADKIWAKWLQPEGQALEGELVRHVMGRFAGSPERSRTLGLCINPPDRICTTIDTQHGRYIGLHIDNFDRMPIMDREKSRNRVCVNLGQGDRWLYFGATTLGAMAHSSGRDAGSHHSIIKGFFRHHPEQPIFLVRVAPGEIYIAPSENIVHDGYTIGNPHPDISFTILGDFHD